MFLRHADGWIKSSLEVQRGIPGLKTSVKLVTCRMLKAHGWPNHRAQQSQGRPAAHSALGTLDGAPTGASTNVR
eukprot:363695-Chlamydomonas_euryale.AAC.3